MTILVIGGSGFIGTHLVNTLLKNRHEVHIFDKKASTRFNELVTTGDVRDPEAIDRAVKGTDVIYNLAAEHRDDVRPVSLYYDVNVQGAKNIVNAADRSNVKKIIFTSTVAVYSLNKPNPDENSPTEPFNDYGKSKLQAEEVFNQWVNTGGGRSLVIVRPVVIFGEGNRGNVYNLIRQIENGKFLMIGKGNNKKSMGYVGNLIQFLIKTTEFGEGKHLFNYADKPDMTTKELVEHIRTKLHIPKTLPSLPYYVGLFGGYIFDALSHVTGKRFPISSIRIKKFCATTTVSTPALESMHFKAPFTLSEGLNGMLMSMKQQG